ncbi:hypothetical protein F0233_06975 [Vibrio splendidus]|nr:hypothetical protein [Vibrio splendidus]
MIILRPVTLSSPFSLFCCFFPKGFSIHAVINSNLEITTWFSETSETAIPENQLEKSPWQ